MTSSRAWELRNPIWCTSWCTKSNMSTSLPALLTISDWRSAAQGGGAPAAALVQRLQALQRDHAGDPAWIMLASAEQVLQQAQAIEQQATALPDRAAVLRAMPLFGVPFAVKDNIDVAGWPTTAACPAFAYTAAHSARAVARLQAAGAVCLGKTDLDQFATGLVGTRSPYGRPASVFAADRVSGGSSSGLAVAVAAGQVAFALGTDTAGSGRVPAGFNHIVGRLCAASRGRRIAVWRPVGGRAPRGGEGAAGGGPNCVRPGGAPRHRSRAGFQRDRCVSRPVPLA